MGKAGGLQPFAGGATCSSFLAHLWTLWHDCGSFTLEYLLPPAVDVVGHNCLLADLLVAGNDFLRLHESRTSREFPAKSEQPLTLSRCGALPLNGSWGLVAMVGS